MNYVPPGFSRWVAYGVKNYILGLLFDREDDDLILHFLDMQGSFPYHRRILFAQKAFDGLEQVSDTEIITGKAKDSIQNVVDADLIRELSKAYNTRIFTNLRVKDTECPEAELDGYVDSCGLWIELTTRNKPLEHLYSKFFHFSCLEGKKVRGIIKVFNELTAKLETSEISLNLKRMLYISLYPVGISKKRLKNIKIVHIMKDRNFLGFLTKIKEGDLQKYLQRRWEEINKSFVELCPK